MTSANQVQGHECSYPTPRSLPNIRYAESHPWAGSVLVPGLYRISQDSTKRGKHQLLDRSPQRLATLFVSVAFNQKRQCPVVKRRSRISCHLGRTVCLCEEKGRIGRDTHSTCVGSCFTIIHRSKGSLLCLFDVWTRRLGRRAIWGGWVSGQHHTVQNHAFAGRLG